MNCLNCGWMLTNVKGHYCPACGAPLFDNVKSYAQPVDKPVDNFTKLK